MSLIFQSWSNSDLEITREAYMVMINKLIIDKQLIPRDKNYQKTFIKLQQQIDHAVKLKKIIEDELSFAE